MITHLFAGYHTHIVKLNHLCSYGSSQTGHPSDLYAVYRTHLVLGNRLCYFGSCKQFTRVNCMLYITHTLIWLTVSFVLPNHKQFIRVNRMLYIAHTFIWLPVSFVPPHRKQLIELNRMHCIAQQLKSEPCLMHPSSQTFCTFLTVFTPPFAIMASHTVSSKGL